MIMEAMQRYPIGIQDFEQLRNNGCIYIDKTDLVYRLANTDSVYFFSRPRRFGKSLLVSTFDAYFSGKKELFNGLAMERLEKDWPVHPVLHLDFSKTKYLSVEDLYRQMNIHLTAWEGLYGTNPAEVAPAERFGGVIQRAYEKTGMHVVVLIDEYDAPLLDSNSDSRLQKALRDLMRQFFSPLKAQGRYLRFLFMTGITKFSQLSIFSELNNLQNISMRDEFSSICGITEDELLTFLKPGIERLAGANSETYEQACEHLKRQYDGYHFSKGCPDLYNPFSLFNALNSMTYDNFWFKSGTPTFLVELLKDMDFNVRDLEGIETISEYFDTPTDNIDSPIPVLYQSGYLTIKGYDPEFQTYRLAYPNNEVQKGFLESLLPNYVHRSGNDSSFYVISFVRDLRKGDIEGCLERTRAFFASIPNDLENKTEKHYQTIFYLLFRLMGQYAETEVKTAIGRADVVLKLSDTIYIFEFKFDGSAEEALNQIESRQYAIPYSKDGRKVIMAGVNFDSRTRTIGDWKIKTLF